MQEPGLSNQLCAFGGRGEEEEGEKGEGEEESLLLKKSHFPS